MSTAKGEKAMNMMANPTEQIERECADRVFSRSYVAETCELALKYEHIIPVDWARVGVAVARRWPGGINVGGVPLGAAAAR